MPLLFVLTVRDHIQDLVAVRPEISIFQEFANVVGPSSSTTDYPFVDDPDLDSLEFI